MSRQEEYEVVWNGSHQDAGRDLLIAQHVVPAVPLEFSRAPRRKHRPKSEWEPRPPSKPWSGRGRPPGIKQQPKVEKFCLECGQQFFLRWPKEGWKHGGRLFCRRRCQSLWQLRQPATWREGLTPAQIERYRAVNASRLELRRAMPDQPCEVCGTLEKIHRHHRDHNPFNNNTCNVAFLCARHHAQQHRIDDGRPMPSVHPKQIGLTVRRNASLEKDGIDLLDE